MVQGGGFEPPKLTRQIYSLIPLAAREPLPKTAGIFRPTRTAVNLFFSINSQSYEQVMFKNGAGERN
jgi:hypothetical protein